MAWLIFLVSSTGVIHVRQTIERQLPVAFESFPWWMPVLVVVLVTRPHAHWIDQPASAADKLHPRVKQPAQQSILERLVEISHQPQLRLDVAVFQFFLKEAQFRRGSTARLQRLQN